VAGAGAADGCTDARLVPAEQAVALATRGAARALGRPDIGMLAPGLRADIVVVDTRVPHLSPRYPQPAAAYSLLAYSAQAGDVRDTCVAGRLLMRERRLLTLDEERVMAVAQGLVNER
jgi:5-methylthioadenosine/S-adenosylhomocysteine deaminase